MAPAAAAVGVVVGTAAALAKLIDEIKVPADDPVFAAAQELHQRAQQALAIAEKDRDDKLASRHVTLGERPGTPERGAGVLDSLKQSLGITVPPERVAASPEQIAAANNTVRDLRAAVELARKEKESALHAVTVRKAEEARPAYRATVVKLAEALVGISVANAGPRKIRNDLEDAGFVNVYGQLQPGEAMVGWFDAKAHSSGLCCWVRERIAEGLLTGKEPCLERVNFDGRLDPPAPVPTITQRVKQVGRKVASTVGII